MLMICRWLSGPGISVTPANLLGAILVLFLCGCSKAPDRRELIAREMKALNCYCCSNAAVARSALLECAEYAHRCQKAKVPGVQYDQVYCRTYSRLFLLDHHLGQFAEAERDLEEVERFSVAAGVHLVSGTKQHTIAKQLESQFDRGLRVSWRAQHLSGMP